MSMLNPSALWGLLALPVIMALLLWRAHRQRQTVPSLLLWDRLVEQGLVSARRRAALFDAAILAAAAFYALGIFALSRPTLIAARPAANRLIVIVDVSASMGTRAEGGTRLELAGERCRQLLEHLSGDWRIAVRSSPSEDAPPLDFSLTKSEALAALAALKPTDAPGNVLETLQQVLPAMPAGEPAGIVILTDHVVGPLPELRDWPIELITVGSLSGNVGIVGFDADEEKGTIFAAVRSFSGAARPVSISAEVDEVAVGTKELNLPPGQRQIAIFAQPLKGARTVAVKLSPDDELTADNAAWSVREPRAELKVAYAGEPDLLIRKALEAAGAEVIDVAAGAGTQGYPLAIYNRVAQPAFSSPHVVLIAPPEGLLGILIRGELEHPAPVVAAPDHPLMKSVTMDGVKVASAVRMLVPDRFSRLVVSDGEALIAVTGGPQGSLVVIAFQPAKSDWPLTASFPIFWLNVVKQASSVLPASGSFGFARTGQTVTVRAGESGRVSISGPETTLDLAPGPGGVAAFVPLRCGLYRHGDDAGERFAANLLDPSESDNGGTTSALDAASVAARLAAPASMARRETPLGPWALLAALVALGLFWLIQKK